MGLDGRSEERAILRFRGWARPVMSPSPSALDVLANRGVADQLSEHEIARSTEGRCGGLAPAEASEKLPEASPPALPVLAA
jgi:hypothetical protein